MQLLAQRKASPIAEEDEMKYSLFHLLVIHQPVLRDHHHAETHHELLRVYHRNYLLGPSQNTLSSCLHPSSATIVAATLREKAKRLYFKKVKRPSPPSQSIEATNLGA
ncbi:hypothetical protein D9756_001030 [Leucocoprinus leucothites]|uniref:Uncharacterized protein n=1 Tax=Leucocoprinus leucothites TaxID=201217 RepID=A0A8H5GET0_9AGAR|nr:hypothetical protein D9756_001030 [Leucoagaricus leucothites]